MKEAIFNLVNGIRSGIPVCCTLFFTYQCRIPGPVGKRIHEERTGKKFNPCEIIEGDAEYVQCGICYKRNKVKEIRENGVIMSWLIQAMKKGDTVYGVNQSGMVGKGVVKGILDSDELVTGYSHADPEGEPCYQVYVGAENGQKLTSIFTTRLFSIGDVFPTYKEAHQRYFFKKLSGDRMIK